MNLANILQSIEIEYAHMGVHSEFESLGLAGYSSGNNVCTFIEDEKYIEGLTSNVCTILTTEKIATQLNRNKNLSIYIVQNPRIVFFSVHNYLAEKNTYARASYETIIGENCQISESAVVAKKNVDIGKNVIIEEFAVIRENTIIKSGSIIRAGSIIGGEGFEFKRSNGEVFRVRHVGGVVIEKNVEIQYNSCVDKAIYPWDNTIIGDFTKIDNLVHVGHAVKIGKRGMIVANCGIGGRVSIGDDVWIGFGATIRNGIKIGNNARANMGAVVTKDIGDGESFTGNFAMPHEEFIRKLTRV